MLKSTRSLIISLKRSFPKLLQILFKVEFEKYNRRIMFRAIQFVWLSSFINFDHMDLEIYSLKVPSLKKVLGRWTMIGSISTLGVKDYFNKINVNKRMGVTYLYPKYSTTRMDKVYLASKCYGYQLTSNLLNLLRI